MDADADAFGFCREGWRDEIDGQLVSAGEGTLVVEPLLITLIFPGRPWGVWRAPVTGASEPPRPLSVLSERFVATPFLN